MFFKEVIGQEATKNRFIQSVKEGRLSHAQLLFGPEGTGKLSLAIAYAQYISCENRGEQDSCGICPSCKKYKKLIHPDLHFVFPVIKNNEFPNAVSDNFIREWREQILSNPYFTLNQWLENLGAENKQGGIFIHESAEILKKLNLKTFESEYKIMIIWLPEKMNIQAANKLLKIIEEPPDKTLFFLVSEAPDLIISTIISRTQQVHIPRIDNEALFMSLQEKFPVKDDDIRYAIILAEGNYISAAEILRQNEDINEIFEHFTRCMRLAYAMKIQDILEWVEEISGLGREKQKEFLLYTLRMIRENFMLNLGVKSIIFMNHRETDFAKKFSSFINSGNSEDIMDELNKAHFHIERNGNPKIIFLDLVLTMGRLLKQKQTAG